MDSDQESSSSDSCFDGKSDSYDENESDLEIDEENSTEDENEEESFVGSEGGKNWTGTGVKNLFKTQFFLRMN